MRLLLDTHALLWALVEPGRLSTTANQLARSAANELFVSAVSLYELGQRHRLGKLPGAGPFLADIDGYLARFNMIDLPVTRQHAVVAATFPVPHRDPFDRILAAQSQLERLPLVTRDQAFAAFGVTTIW